MENNSYIHTGVNGETAHISLNRPETRNAFHIEMIRELSAAIDRFSADSSLRLLVFESSAEDFSSGADLNWMKGGLTHPGERLFSESLEMAELFRKIYESPLVSIALVKGNVMGGANGIIAACDFCLAETGSRFGLTEVRLGLLPATISPYIIRKTGISRARELMLTGKTISAEEALTLGLISECAEKDKLWEQFVKLENRLLANGPEALRGVKSLLRSIENREIDSVLSKGTADVISRFRKSPEGQEGISAFLEKRSPSWIKNGNKDNK